MLKSRHCIPNRHPGRSTPTDRTSKPATALSRPEPQISQNSSSGKPVSHPCATKRKGLKQDFQKSVNIVRDGTASYSTDFSPLRFSCTKQIEFESSGPTLLCKAVLQGLVSPQSAILVAVMNRGMQATDAENGHDQLLDVGQPAAGNTNPWARRSSIGAFRGPTTTSTSTSTLWRPPNELNALVQSTMQLQGRTDGKEPCRRRGSSSNACMRELLLRTPAASSVLFSGTRTNASESEWWKTYRGCMQQ